MWSVKMATLFWSEYTRSNVLLALEMFVTAMAVVYGAVVSNGRMVDEGAGRFGNGMMHVGAW